MVDVTRTSWHNNSYAFSTRAVLNGLTLRKFMCDFSVFMLRFMFVYGLKMGLHMYEKSSKYDLQSSRYPSSERNRKARLGV